MDDPAPLTKPERERIPIYYRNGNPGPSLTDEHGHKWVAEPLVQHARDVIARYEVTCQALERQLAETNAELEAQLRMKLGDGIVDESLEILRR